MIGSVVGNYRIIEKLGEGGMGVVYKAVDSALDRPVAIKMLPPELSRDAGLMQRFQTEARAQAQLSHTNLATLYAFLTHEGNHFMVMEYVDGETFAQMVARRGPIPAAEIVPLFKQALLGLGYAHRHGIIHRDIKPGNLMVNPAGIVKVMDFGIAKVLGGRQLTRTGTQVGTVNYMAPEQIQNRPVDIRTDIYALGVTLYEMASGRVPFEGESDFQVMTDHVNAPPPPPTKFYPYIPQFLSEAILRALAKSPDERFQTVEVFGAALEGWERPSQATVYVPAEQQIASHPRTQSDNRPPASVATVPVSSTVPAIPKRTLFPLNSSFVQLLVGAVAVVGGISLGALLLRHPNSSKLEMGEKSAQIETETGAPTPDRKRKEDNDDEKRDRPQPKEKKPAQDKGDVVKQGGLKQVLAPAEAKPSELPIWHVPIHLSNLGDPLGIPGPPSSGPGTGGTGGGVGPGEGGGVFRVGGDVSAPSVLYRVEPTYSEEARQAKYQGVVVLSTIVRKDGSIEILKVVRGLGLGLDENAIAALRQWRFRPGVKNGVPVDVALNVEVNFSLGLDSWTGWITDSMCGGRLIIPSPTAVGLSGLSPSLLSMGHRACALACAKAGQQLVLYSPTERKLYFLDNQVLAANYAGYEVRVQGTADGTARIKVSSIVPR